MGFETQNFFSTFSSVVLEDAEEQLQSMMSDSSNGVSWVSVFCVCQT